MVAKLATIKGLATRLSSTSLITSSVDRKILWLSAFINTATDLISKTRTNGV